MNAKYAECGGITVALDESTSKFYRHGSERWQQIIDSGVEIEPYVEPEITPDDLKTGLLQKVKAIYMDYYSNPWVDTGLGFRVDSGYNSLTDFRVAREKGLLTIRCYDNNFHPVSDDQLGQIIDAVTGFGIQCKTAKWALDVAIMNADDPEDVDLLQGWPSREWPPLQSNDK